MKALARLAAAGAATVAFASSHWCPGIAQAGAFQPQSTSGWGVDACLTTRVPIGDRTGYLQLLKGSGVRWLRERSPSPELEPLKRAGYSISCFVGNMGVPIRPGEALPVDLLAVYHAAYNWTRSPLSQLVDAWEMVNEPDLGYCIDLPDRLAAYQKAVYLGLTSARVRDSGKAFPLVLMGALALPPGPWLRRAEKNGLLEYTDAYNFHFYGEARDLSGVIAAHRRFTQGHPLPLWITECGINAVPDNDWSNAAGRLTQARFTVSTAQTILREPEVAVFMPFVLAGADDPHALTMSSAAPFPAWTDYAAFTNAHPLKPRPLAKPPTSPNPIVLEWVPDLGSGVRHKVSGTYRFYRRQPIHGELRIYNLSASSVCGRLNTHVPPAFGGSLSPKELPYSVTVPADGLVTLRAEFTAPAQGYARGACAFDFLDQSGRCSAAEFGLETWPEATDFISRPVELGRPAGGAGPNGLNRTPWLTSPELHADSEGGQTTFWTDRISHDPFTRTVASAAITHLPAKGFLRLQLDRPMSPGRTVEVDLVDRDGQRFCIWENLGQSYYRQSSEVWLNLEDMQPHLWGRCTAEPNFRAAQINLIQLRFLNKTPNQRIPVRLSWMTARTLPNSTGSDLNPPSESP